MPARVRKTAFISAGFEPARIYQKFQALCKDFPSAFRASCAQKKAYRLGRSSS